MRSAAVAVFALLAVPIAAGVKIVDAAGSPVPGATVTILLESNDDAAEVLGDEPLVHTTDDRGRLAFELPRVDGATAVVDHERFAPEIVKLDSETARASVVLQEGITLKGRLTGDGSTPAGPGTVCAIQPVSTRKNGETFEVRRCAAVAADGMWTLRALRSGTQRLDIRVPGYLPSLTAITLPSEPWSGRLEAGERVRLQVEDAAGRVAAGATIECGGAVPVTTDARGTAWIAIASGGSKCRALGADDSESPFVEIAPSSKALATLRLRQVRTATARLMTNDGSDPLAPRLTLLGRIDDIGQSSTRVESMASNAETFRVRLPVEGPHAIRIEAPGMLPLTTDWFTLPAEGGTADLGVLILRRGAGVRGRVVDAATQAPLAGAVVSLEAQGRARIVLGRFGKTSAMTDSDGSFTVSGVGIGSYRMRVAWRDLPPRDTAVDLLEENVLSLDTIALHRGVRVSGNVFRSDREPLADARVELIPSRLYDETEPVASATTSSDGAFGSIVIAPGTYRLLVRAGDLLFDQEIAIRDDNDATNVDVHIRSARLTGVIRERGVPLTGGEVLLQRPDTGNLGVVVARNLRTSKQLWSGRSESSFEATVDGAGVFLIDNVPSGRMLLEYFGRSGERARRSIDVPDQKEASLVVDVDGWSLQGRVDDAQSETGLSATVNLVGSDGTAIYRGPTDVSGDFASDRLAAGTYTLVASADGYRTSDPVRVVVGNEAPPPTRIRLAKAEDAALDIVVTRDGSIPAAGVALSIVDVVGRQLRASPTLVDGKLPVPGLSAGTVHIIWSDPLAGVGISPPIRLEPGQQKVSLALQPAKDLIVRCEASDCSGARLGTLALTSEHGIDLAPFLQRGGAVVYSENGTAHLGRLAPGTYRVTASSGALRLQQELKLPSGPGEVDLFLTR